VLAVQRMAGNRAVAGLMRTPDTAAPSMRARGWTMAVLTIIGHKQGRFKGDGKDGAITAEQLRIEVSAPLDHTTRRPIAGQETRQVTFTKAMDGTSPQFTRAFANDEVLDTVRIAFIADADNAAQTPLKTFTLINAKVSDLSHATDEGGSRLDKVTLTFERFEVVDGATKAAATDDWNVP
jgi:type VI secretion system Hcp family effector